MVMIGKFQLIRATADNEIWKRLRTSWDKQLDQHGAPEDWATPFLDHAQDIVNEGGIDPRYGIFIACGGSPRKPGAPYEGFVHINFKLMRTSAAEIRLVWNRLAPKFQFEDLKNQVAEIQATFLIGALEMSYAHERKPPVKMFLGNPIDIAFGRNFALLASRIPAIKLNASVRGNWLHLSRAEKKPKKRR